MKISLSLEITRNHLHKGPYTEVKWDLLTKEERSFISRNKSKPSKKNENFCSKKLMSELEREADNFKTDCSFYS